MKKIMINHTNHPSARWSEAQITATRAYGEVVDDPFPAIGADWSEEEVVALAREKGAELVERHPAAVLLQGEFTYVYALARLLVKAGIPVLAACSRRISVERQEADGTTTTTSRFDFTRFRRYEEA